MAVTLLHDLAFPDRSRGGREIVLFRHRLEETGLFSDAALGRLIDETRRGDLAVRTAGLRGPEPWISGEPGRLSGAELIAAARRGRLQIELPATQDIRYARVFARLLDELASAAGLKTIDASMRILISSPGLAAAFHVEAGEALRFSVRGEESLQYLAPSTTGLDEKSLDAILRHEASADLRQDRELAEGAASASLGPGLAAWVPLHAAHRCVNSRDLGVAVLLSFDSPRARRLNGVVYTNGVLRRRLGLHPDSNRTPDLLQPAYHAAARLLRSWKRPSVAPPAPQPVRFVVDLEAPGCIRWGRPRAPLHAA